MEISNQSVIIVEDELKIAQLVRDYVQPLFQKVKIITNGNEVMGAVAAEQPDFMLLDIMLPGMDGLEILKQVRAKYHFPVLMLTAKSEEIDRVMGLEFGADDYLVKPFSPREMVARVKAILKRVYPTETHDRNEFTHKGLTLNTSTHLATIDGQDVKFTPTEFSILLLFVKNPNVVFERFTIMQKVLGYEFEGYERTIDAHIKNIRKKIAHVTPQEKIESIYGIGYKLIA